MTTHTIRLHRVVRSNPERVYRAFLSWLDKYRSICVCCMYGYKNHLDRYGRL